MDVALSVRLSALMFLQYSIIGACVPVLGPYLSDLHFSFTETAWIWSTSALGAMLAPLIWGQIADRWVAAEKCISLCAVVSGVTLWWASLVTDAWSFFWLYFVFWLFQMPLMSIGSALTFRHLDHPERQFGPIRVWGTIGWMVASWLFNLWLFLRYDQPREHFADSLRSGALAAWVLAIYAFTLPATPPLPAGISPAHHGLWRRLVDAPVRAFQLFHVPSFAVYCVCMFVLYVSWPFNMQMTSLLVSRLSDGAKWLPAIMTLSQTTEVLTLATLPFILGRLGQKRTMVVGIVSWSLALIVLTIGGPFALVIPSLLLHGLFICCFLVAGQVFVNRIAHHDFRASAQGLLVLINGVGQFLGNFLVSALRAWTHDDFSRTFLPAAIGVSLLAVFFMLAFRPQPPQVREII